VLLCAASLHYRLASRDVPTSEAEVAEDLVENIATQLKVFVDLDVDKHAVDEHSAAVAGPQTGLFIRVPEKTETKQAHPRRGWWGPLSCDRTSVNRHGTIFQAHPSIRTALPL
jgi:hypothetical protein